MKILDIEKYRNKEGYVENINLMPDELHQLLDYITKLQQENQQLKKQKDDVFELINYYGITPEQNDNVILRHILKDILRMLGEIE